MKIIQEKIFNIIGDGVFHSKLLMIMVSLSTLGGLTCNSANAQTTKIFGAVIDEETKEPLPFVNISFQNSKIGTTSDVNGKYSLETYYATDSLTVSFVGYSPQTKKINKDKEQQIDFHLSKSNITLEEVSVYYNKKEDPVVTLMKSVVANKKINNKEKLDAYEYETYNKVEFDLNNIGDKFSKKKLFKPFDFIFDNIDTTAEKKISSHIHDRIFVRTVLQEEPKNKKRNYKGYKSIWN